eukprot:scaffold38423_cov51-Attheya_sp.AAC.1
MSESPSCRQHHRVTRKYSGRISFNCRTLLILAFCLITKGSCLAVKPGVTALHATREDVIPLTTAVISKKDGGGKRNSIRYVFDDDTDSSSQQHQKGIGIRKNNNHVGMKHKWSRALADTFLPRGFPKRTPEGYLTYATWSWVQDVSTQLRGVLATQRVLEGVGVGRDGATVLSASLNFIVRDGCGMAATLLFTAGAASFFRSDVKRWRLFADLIVDVGITLEVAATLVPRSLFLPMICVGNMCKAICGVASGACGGAINLYWAKGSDISDINAKFGAQHTVTGSLGLLFAAFFARSVSMVQPTTLWTLFGGLTALHIYANAKCMRLIAFDTLNNIRMNMLMSEFFTLLDKDGDRKATSSTVSPLAPKHYLSNIHTVSKAEPLLFLSRRPPHLSQFPIDFGVSFNHFAQQTGKSHSELQRQLLTMNSTRGYFLSITQTQERHRLIVCLCDGATPEQNLKAYFHAHLLGRCLARRGIHVRSKRSHEERESLIQEAETDATESVDSLWSQFQSLAQASGWDLSFHAELRSDGYEVSLEHV